jgi:hypothetical protein
MNAVFIISQFIKRHQLSDIVKDDLYVSPHVLFHKMNWGIWRHTVVARNWVGRYYPRYIKLAQQSGVTARLSFKFEKKVR